MDTRRRRHPRPLVVVALGAVALGLLAGPVFGVDPTASPDPAPAEDPRGRDRLTDPGPPAEVPPPAAERPRVEPPGRSRERVPSTPIQISGTVGTTTDADGDVVYTLVADGRAYELGAGPPWWWADDHPLADKVGDAVAVTGEIADGSDEIDVETVDGEPLRDPGKPPWAGGPKAVGERHPGWAAWSAAHPDGEPGNGRGLGRERAPGQQRDAAADD